MADPQAQLEFIDTYRMPVELITERLSIEPNRVFIIPSNRDLYVEDGEFLLKPISKLGRQTDCGDRLGF